MLRRPLRVVVPGLAVVVLLSLCAVARAAPVLVMGHDGRVHRVENRFLGGPADPAPPVGAASLRAAGGRRVGVASPRPAGGRLPSGRTAQRTRAGAPPGPRSRARVRHHPTPVTVPVVLARLARARAISTQTATLDLRRWRAALAEERHLPPVRRAQLTAVTVIVHDLAARGALTAGRLPEVFLMLERNMQWWWHGPLLSYGQRVAFAGSALEWEYYPGAGIQLQVLGTFGEANGFYEAGRADWPRLTALMNEMIPLAVPRGGGLAWEYLFPWEGGSPPWVSAMAQATALEALANAYRVSHDPIYLSTGEQALGILETPPPVGVAQTTALGTRFLQYSFAPQTDIINAFLQTLIGLDDFAQVSGDVTAQRLFRSGDAQAQAELPSFNTGAWSLYQPGESDDLSYHQLVTGFLQTLCGLTRTPLYCATAQDFSADLTTAPTIVQRTLSVRARHLAHLVFRLDKPARVGVIVTAPRGRDVLYTSADCQPGTDYWILPKLARGTYAVTLSATDLAGNYRTVSGTLRVR